ncbi:hypothetical protein pipiens_018939 [Culex pipiens pipiens]|uniref:Uncharacterized protein n=1 Tax=Culex pipiens pipiens TaxID=38569 RepID=A0ABD1DY01_CULPP
MFIVSDGLRDRFGRFQATAVVSSVSSTHCFDDSRRNYTFRSPTSSTNPSSICSSCHLPKDIERANRRRIPVVLLLLVPSLALPDRVWKRSTEKAQHHKTIASNSTKIIG